VHAIYGSPNGLTAQGNQAWRQGNNGIRDSAEANDSFGFSLATGDFNGDGYADVAAGGPGEDNLQGLVIVIFGSAGGLTSNGNQRWREGDDGLRGGRENSDLFGYELAAGDFNGDGYDDLAVGTPGENNSRGTANIIYGSSGGLTSTGNVRRQQGDDGLPDDDENDDSFAEVMAAGDFNNDGFDDLVVAALGEDSGRGAVIVIPGSSGGLSGAGSTLWRQGEAGVGGGEREAGDRFGSAFAIGDFNLDGFVDLALGIRGEDNSVGLVQTLPGSSGGLTAQGGQVLAQGFDNLQDQAEAGDNFGFDLAAGNFGSDGAADLAVGAPGEDNARGVVHIVLGRSPQPPPIVGAAVGGGLSIPPVAQASFNSIVTIYGQNFFPAAVAALQPGNNQGGSLPTSLNGICVEMNGRRAPLFGHVPTQINAQTVTVPGEASVSVEVLVNCGLPNQLRSNSFNLVIAPASPEFFFFLANLDGVNPIAAFHNASGNLVGTPGLRPDGVFEPARPGDVVTVFLTGLGLTEPRYEPGALATGPASAVLPVSIQIGGADVETIYAGVTPTFAGLYQASFRIPLNAPAGNLPVRVTVGAATTPAGGYLTIQP
jgi:uncharacterized protein (TIGR03437 family)